VVGSGDGSPTWQNSPMHFPVAGNADALTYGDFAIAKAQGKTQIAVLSCVEASSCTGWKAAASKYAPKAGVTLTYTADISITQPDFTSECLNARNKGVQVMAVIADSNTLYRVARSCSQQNFKPTYIAPSPDDRDAANPALDGAIGAMHTFPYFGVGGSAVSDAFRAAVKKYAPDAPQQQYLATGYASGKVFEAAAAKAIGTGAPSSAKVLDGLWSLAQGETLGGLVLPLHYQKDKPTAMVFCYYPGIITGGRYTAPGGMRPTCATP
jgi:branched-chain amino acid transport system substrate-binding protein